MGIPAREPTSMRGRLLAAAVALALAAGLALLAPGGAVQKTQAATPSSGTLSTANPVVQWAEGPFDVPANPLDDCMSTGDTDDFMLTVSTPAGFGDTHRMQIEVQWSQPTADFDVCLLNGAGTTVIAEARSTADPEFITVAPNSGNYIVRVIPFEPAPIGGLPQRYTGIASFVDYRAPATTSLTKPSYVNYHAPDLLFEAHDSGEPSIGVNYRTNRVMYQSGLATYRVIFNDAYHPATAAWEDRTARPPNCPTGATTSLDPILFTDHDTGRTFESQLLANPTTPNSLTCYTDDDGDTWHVSQGGGIFSGADHQTIGGGPFSPNGLLGPLTPYPHAVYYCSQDVGDAQCATSYDGGITFNVAHPAWTINQCGGLHGHIKVAPDGVVYVPNKSCPSSRVASTGRHQGAAVSIDNGVTWAIRRIPTSNPGDTDPSIGIGANNTVYFGYMNDDDHGTEGTDDDTATARIAVSHDEGETWSKDTDVGAQLGIKNMVFPEVTAGDDNRAAFAFLGTTTPGDYQAADFKGVWHLYIATTTDGGNSWVTVDATPTDPVQRGPICTGGTTCGDSRNLLDFNDITQDREGRVVVAYADGCTGPCVNGTGDPNADYYHDAQATIARQDAGPRMFAKFDPKPDLIVFSVQAFKGSDGYWYVSGIVKNQGNATASNVTVRFFVCNCCSNTAIGTTAPITLNPGYQRKVWVRWVGAKPGTYTILAVADPDNKVAESNEGNNRNTGQVTIQ